MTAKCHAYIVEISTDEATLTDILADLTKLLKEWGYPAWVTPIPEDAVPLTLPRKKVK